MRRFAVLVLWLVCVGVAGAQEKAEALKPFSVDVSVDQKYKFATAKNADTTPVGVSLSYRAPFNIYRVAVGYAYVPEKQEHSVTFGIKMRLFQFGRRR